MILQDKKMNTYTRYVSAFKGLNRLPVSEEGELLSSVNMAFDYFPVMTVREGRSVNNSMSGTPQAFLRRDEDTFAVIGSTLYVNYSPTSLSGLSSGEKSMVEFWDKIFIFPDKKFYDLSSGESGDMGKGTFPEDGSVPDIDYACVHNNRIWGVKDNYIYASASGWAMGAAAANGVQGWVPGYDDMGYPNDLGACWFEVASDGAFRAISSWDDKIVALKSSCHHEITGSYPSNFALSTVSKCGTRWNNSVCEVDGKLIFVSDRGVQSYGGSFETNIGRNLNERWEDATIYGAGTDGVRYYLSGSFEGEEKLYVYDSYLGAWTEEDNPGLRYFSDSLGILESIGDDGSVYRMRTGAGDDVLWSFSFSGYDDSIYRQSRPLVLTLKVKGKEGSAFIVEMSSDGGDFEVLSSVLLDGNTLRDIKCRLRRAGDHLFRISGTGDVSFYGYQLKIQDGGDHNG